MAAAVRTADNRGGLLARPLRKLAVRRLSEHRGQPRGAAASGRRGQPGACRAFLAGQRLQAATCLTELCCELPGHRAQSLELEAVQPGRTPVERRTGFLACENVAAGRTQPSPCFACGEGRHATCRHRRDTDRGGVDVVAYQPHRRAVRGTARGKHGEPVRVAGAGRIHDGAAADVAPPWKTEMGGVLALRRQPRAAHRRWPVGQGNGGDAAALCLPDRVDPVPIQPGVAGCGNFP